MVEIYVEFPAIQIWGVLLLYKRGKWWVNTTSVLVHRRLEINLDIDIDTLIYNVKWYQKG